MLMRPEQELLAQGDKQNSIEKGAFYQNVYLSQGGWEVRRGFGVLGQWDSTLSSSSQTDVTKAHGYAEVLGSTVFFTNFGHLQIVTLLRQERAYTSNNSDESGQYLSLYSVSIYDTTTDRRWEETLYSHTKNQAGSPLPMPYWQGHYQTNKTVDKANWINARETTQTPFFQEYLDTLVFGSPAIGLWVYRPVDPEYLETGHGQTDASHPTDSGQYLCRAESSCIAPIVPSDGQFVNDNTYLSNDAFPNAIVDCCVIQGRVAYAQGREVYFSDSGRPGCIPGLNVLTVQSDQEITALSEINGNLLIWTPTQTWLYRIPPSFICSGGELTLLNNEIGCLGSLSHVKMKGACCWVSKRGIYVSTGNFDFNSLSANLDSLFLQGISNPLTSWYVDTGKTVLTDPQPRTFYDWEQLNRVSLTYDAKSDSLFCSVPDQECCWVYTQSAWVLWNFESLANSQVPVVVQGLRNLPKTQILTYDGQVFGVHGVENYPAADVTQFHGAVPEDFSSPPGSYFITQWGRGGSADRSSEPREDNRIVCGVYQTSIAGDSFFEIGKPIHVPQGYQFPQGTQTTRDTLVYPLYLSPVVGAIALPDHLDLVFLFDNLQWSPITVGASPELDIILPSERQQSSNGWGVGAPVPGLAEAQVYQGGVAALNGNQIRLRFDGTHGMAINTWTTAPQLNVQEHERHLLMWIGFEPNPNALTGDAMSLGVEAGQAQQIDGVNSHDLGVIFWSEPFLRSKLETDEKVQPVDWVIKSEQISNKAQQIRTRGVWWEQLSHGRETDHFLYGQLNFLVGSDYKDWVSQILDYSDSQDPNLDKQVKSLTDETGNTNTVRSRHRSSLGKLVPKFLNRELRWGDQATPLDGNYLIDEEQKDTISLSDSVKGESIAWMAFGHLRGRAERLVVSSFRAILDTAGNPRRWGR